MVNAKRLLTWPPVLTLGLLSLNACTFLPTTGPSAGTLAHEASLAKTVHLEKMTPARATTLYTTLRASQNEAVRTAIAGLKSHHAAVPVTLEPGDKVDVTLWTQPMLAGLSANSNAQSSVIQKTDFGDYTVDGRGLLSLPYAGLVRVDALTVPGAERRISERFGRIGQFEQPQVTVTIARNRRQHIIVTGAANHPLILDWRTGGITLGDAITEAGGYRIFRRARGRDLTRNVVVVHRGASAYRLPMRVAVDSNVPLYPGDDVVLEHKTPVRVQCLGGGWAHDTQQRFDDTPTLAEVVASGGGLSTQRAQGAAVYVLSHDHRTIYEFPWDSLDGIRAAQIFPVQDDDVVYVSTSPSVKFQQIVGILFDAAYPVATGHAVF